MGAYRYKIAAYNNRMYTGYRFVDNKVRSLIGAKFWIAENGNRNRYLYNIYDTTTEKFLYDYTDLFRDFEHAKKIIRSSNSLLYEETVINYINNFKKKWEPKAGVSISAYFEDLMTLFNTISNKTVPINI